MFQSTPSAASKATSHWWHEITVRLPKYVSVRLCRFQLQRCLPIKVISARSFILTHAIGSKLNLSSSSTYLQHIFSISSWKMTSSDRVRPSSTQFGDALSQRQRKVGLFIWVWFQKDALILFYRELRMDLPMWVCGYVQSRLRRGNDPKKETLE